MMRPDEAGGLALQRARLPVWLIPEFERGLLHPAPRLGADVTILVENPETVEGDAPARWRHRRSYGARPAPFPTNGGGQRRPPLWQRSQKYHHSIAYGSQRFGPLNGFNHLSKWKTRWNNYGNVCRCNLSYGRRDVNRLDAPILIIRGKEKGLRGSKPVSTTRRPGGLLARKQKRGRRGLREAEMSSEFPAAVMPERALGATCRVSV